MRETCFHELLPQRLDFFCSLHYSLVTKDLSNKWKEIRARHGRKKETPMEAKVMATMFFGGEI
jgi:hypothetical protein